MATAPVVQEWDASGKPITASSGNGATEWDASGKPISSTTSTPNFTDNSNGEGTYAMWNHSGQRLEVPYSKVPDAAREGYTFDENKNKNDLLPMQQFLRDQAADPNRSTGPTNAIMGMRDAGPGDPAAGPMQPFAGLMEGMGTIYKPVLDVLGMVTGVPQSKIDESLTPHSGVERAAKYATIGGVIAPGAIMAPAATVGGLLTGTAGGMAGNAIGNAAGMSPNATAVLSDVTGLGAGLAGGAGAEALANRTTPPIAGENFTPSQLKAHAAVIANGSPAGNVNYIPQTLAKNTGSFLRDVAAASPEDMQSINNGTPIEAAQARLNQLNKAKTAIDQSHQQVLQQVANTPVDTKSLQDAIQPSKFKLQGMDDADKAFLSRLQQRAANIKDLGGLNEFRMMMNDEDTTLGKNPVAGMSAGSPALVHQMANVTRNAYYDALQQASGQNFQPVKQLEGNIISLIQGESAAFPRAAINEAKTAGTLPSKYIGDVVEGSGKTGQPGLPIVSGLATKAGDAIRGTPLKQLQSQLQRFYSDLPAQPSMQLPTGVSPSTIASRYLNTQPLALPAQSGGAYPMPGTVPFSPNMSAGERSAALNQWLRQRQQLALPAKASAIPLPPPQ